MAPEKAKKKVKPPTGPQRKALLNAASDLNGSLDAHPRTLDILLERGWIVEVNAFGGRRGSSGDRNYTGFYHFRITGSGRLAVKLPKLDLNVAKEMARRIVTAERFVCVRRVNQDFTSGTFDREEAIRRVARGIMSNSTIVELCGQDLLLRRRWGGTRITPMAVPAESAKDETPRLAP
jgi:hypothetical protein